MYTLDISHFCQLYHSKAEKKIISSSRGKKVEFRINHLTSKKKSFAPSTALRF